jgi:hypothetical protein
MFLLALSVTVSKIQADWLAYLITAAQTPPPDNLVTFLWICISALGAVILAMAAYIRILLTEIRAIERERHAHDLAVTEKLITVTVETRGAVKDAAEAIEILAAKLERSSRARNERNKKTP